MPLFLSTYVNRVDKKGRVSVPARYRAALAGQMFNGVIAFPSYVNPAIEACGLDFLEGLQDRLGAYDPFSEERDDLTTSIMSESHELAFDGEGRIVLPQALMSHADITTQVAFVGRGDHFQIWEPGAAERHKTEARQRVGRHRGRLAQPRGADGRS